MAYRDRIASTGRFLTFCGGAAVIGQRLRPDPRERVSIKRVSENGQGMVVRGRLGMHTSPAYAEDVYVGALTGLEIDGHPAGFIVPVNAPGVTVLCRRAATRDRDPFTLPLSSRYDELDGQMWLDDVFIPWERVFAVDPEPEAIPRWLRWHHLRGWLARAEFTLGLALALTDAMGLKQNEATVGYLVDLMAEVQTGTLLPHRRGARPRVHAERLLRAEAFSSRRRRHLAVQSAPIHVRDTAYYPRLVASGGTDRQRSCHARVGGRT